MDATLFPIEEEQIFATRTRLKTRDLARTCGWLDAVLRQQDRIMELLDALDGSRDATSWMRQWGALEVAVLRSFRVEETVLAPAIQAMGLRAHVVVAEMCRKRIRRDLEDLRVPSWEDDGVRVRQLGLNLASHFAQQENCAYRALARQQDEHAKAELTQGCVATLAALDA